MAKKVKKDEQIPVIPDATPTPAIDTPATPDQPTQDMAPVAQDNAPATDAAPTDKVEPPAEETPAPPADIIGAIIPANPENHDYDVRSTIHPAICTKCKCEGKAGDRVNRGDGRSAWRFYNTPKQQDGQLAAINVVCDTCRSNVQMPPLVNTLDRDFRVIDAMSKADQYCTNNRIVEDKARVSLISKRWHGQRVIKHLADGEVFVQVFTVGYCLNAETRADLVNRSFGRNEVEDVERLLTAKLRAESKDDRRRVILIHALDKKGQEETRNNNDLKVVMFFDFDWKLARIEESEGKFSKLGDVFGESGFRRTGTSTDREFGDGRGGYRGQRHNGGGKHDRDRNDRDRGGKR